MNVNITLQTVEIRRFSLKELLKQHKITKTELALRLGISRQWVTALLKDEDNLTIEQFSKILEVIGYTLELSIKSK